MNISKFIKKDLMVYTIVAFILLIIIAYFISKPIIEPFSKTYKGDLMGASYEGVWYGDIQCLYSNPQGRGYLYIGKDNSYLLQTMVVPIANYDEIPFLFIKKQNSKYYTYSYANNTWNLVGELKEDLNLYNANVSVTTKNVQGLLNKSQYITTQPYKIICQPYKSKVSNLSAEFNLPI